MEKVLEKEKACGVTVVQDVQLRLMPGIPTTTPSL